jgi:hypothetical protein
MKRKLLSLLCAGASIGLLAGCVSTVDGRSRAGVPFATDTIESRYERPPAQIFDAAKRVLAYHGTLTADNTINNSLEARVDTRTVWVAVDEVEPKVSRVRTQFRTKGGGGDIHLASEIDKQIALLLK